MQCLFTGGTAPTPSDSDNDMNDDLPPPSSPDPSDLPPEEDDLPPDQSEPQAGSQKAVAVVMELHPPEMLAKLCSGLKKSQLKIVENVRSFYAVPPGQQSEGVSTAELRVGMKRAATSISQSEYEVYSFATRHNLSEAATDELLQMLTNMSISHESL